MEEPPTPQPSNPPPAASPVMDVVPPPAGSTVPAVETKSALKLPPANPAAQTQLKKPAGQSVNAAIAATVIIVLGLALLAVYAYLAQKH